MANRSVKTSLFVVLNTNLRFESIMFVISSISKEFDKQSFKSLPLVVLNTICSFVRTRDVQISIYSCVSKLNDIRLNSFDLANRSVKTRLFVVLNTNLRFQSITFVIRSISIEFDK